MRERRWHLALCQFANLAMPAEPAPSGSPLTIRAREVAQILGITPNALKHRRDVGEFDLPPARGGGRGRPLEWNRADLYAYLREQGLAPEPLQTRGKAS